MENIKNYDVKFVTEHGTNVIEMKTKQLLNLEKTDGRMKIENIIMRITEIIPLREKKLILVLDY